MKRPVPNLDDCEARLRYRFADRDLLKKALTHSSCANARVDSNERLEFLGDAALGLVVSNLLFRRFPKLTEGELSKIKGSVVSRKTCRRVATRLDLQNFLFVGKGIDAIPDSLVANVMESVVGAIYLDGGYEEARLFVEERFEPEIDAYFQPRRDPDDESNDARRSTNDGRNGGKIDGRGGIGGGSNAARGEVARNGGAAFVERVPSTIEPSDVGDDNFKARFQTELRREKILAPPEYVLLDEKGPSHSRCFKIGIRVGERRFQAAWGTNKKETEQRAAENALCELAGLEPPHPDGD